MKPSTRSAARRESERPIVRPVFVSQHTAPTVLGFKTSRAFLEWLETSGCRVVERGKDRLVQVDEAEAALLRTSNSVAEAHVASIDATEPVTASAVLARIGRRMGGAR